jgi:hypothetical protein
MQFYIPLQSKLTQVPHIYAGASVRYSSLYATERNCVKMGCLWRLTRYQQDP